MNAWPIDTEGFRRAGIADGYMPAYLDKRYPYCLLGSFTLARLTGTLEINRRGFFKRLGIGLRGDQRDAPSRCRPDLAAGHHLCT